MKTTPRLFATSALLLAVAGSASAATYSWTDLVNGTPVSANWSTGTSWSGVPVSAADTTLSFGMTYGVNSTAETNTLTNNVASPFLLNVLTFAGNTPSAGSGSNNAVVNITGSPLSLVLNGLTTPVVNLNSNRSNGQLVTYNVQSDVALAAGTLFTGNGTATFNFSGQLSGSAFTKSGSSTLTLSGANNYSGNATLSAGALILANNSALSSGSLNLTGNARVGIANGVNISNAINPGASTLTYFSGSTASNSVGTYSGAISGSGTINIGNSNSGNNTTILDFTNVAGFTGNVVGAAGNAVGADYFRFSSIGDGGNFTFNKSGNRGGVIYNGTSAIEFDTRQIALGTSFGGGGTYGVNGNGAVQNAFQNNATNAAHTVTFNSDLAVGAISSSSLFYFDGTNTGNNEFAGDIADASGANTLGIGKQGTGKWILSGDNSYEGNTFILNGTLSVTSIANVGNNQATGHGSLIYFSNSSTTTSTLEFTGSAISSTDKQVVIGSNNNAHNGGGAIVNNGNGTLTFSNATFNASTGLAANATVDRTLTLGGSNAGANTISGTILDNVASAAQVLLTKTGDGKWILGGDNTYTGVTNVNGGTLLVNGNSSAAIGAVTVAAAGTLGGIGTVGGNTTVNGILSPGNSPGTITFAGNLTLNNNSTYLFEGGDLTDVLGTLDLNDNWILSLGSGFANGGSVTLFNYGTLATTPDLVPTFDIANLGFTPTGPLSLENTGTSIVLNGISIVPEPGSFALMTLGMLMIARRRRD